MTSENSAGGTRSAGLDIAKARPFRFSLSSVAASSTGNLLPAPHSNDNGADLLLSLAASATKKKASGDNPVTPSPAGMKEKNDDAGDYADREQGQLVVSLRGTKQVYSSPIKVSPRGEKMGIDNTTVPSGNGSKATANLSNAQSLGSSLGRRRVSGNDSESSTSSKRLCIEDSSETAGEQDREEPKRDQNAPPPADAARDAPGSRNRVISPASSHEGQKGEDEEAEGPKPKGFLADYKPSPEMPAFSTYPHGLPAPQPYPAHPAVAAPPFGHLPYPHHSYHPHPGAFLGGHPPPPPYYNPAMMHHYPPPPHMMYPPMPGYGYPMPPTINTRKQTPPSSPESKSPASKTDKTKAVSKPASDKVPAVVKSKPAASPPPPAPVVATHNPVGWNRRTPTDPNPMDLSHPGRKRCIPRSHMGLPSDWSRQVALADSIKIPEFSSLVNFPGYLARGRNSSSPKDGKRCCVMCGKSRVSRTNRGKAQQDKATGESTHIIPRQNKGVCTACDVSVWVVLDECSHRPVLEIKWCKGCKNFRPWALFGDKLMASKCIRCRDRQKEKYAQQKRQRGDEEPCGHADEGIVSAADGLRNLMNARPGYSSASH